MTSGYNNGLAIDNQRPQQRRAAVSMKGLILLAGEQQQ